MPDDAEALGPVEAAGGGGEQPVGPADQQVTCGRVAAALGAHVRLLRQLRSDAAAQGCEEGHRRVSAPQLQSTLQSYLFTRNKRQKFG